MDFSDDSYSFEILPIQKRKKNIKEMMKWIKHKKIESINHTLTKEEHMTQLFEQCAISPPGSMKIQEIEEMQELMNNIFAQTIREQLKQETKKTKAKPLQQPMIKDDDDEIVENKELLEEIRQKMIFLLQNQVPLPFILNFIDVKKKLKEPKLTIICEQPLLDALNFILVSKNYSEDLVKEKTKQVEDCKLKILLKHILEILYQKRQIVAEELTEMFVDIRSCKTQILKKLEYLKQKNSKLELHSVKSFQIIVDLIEFCKAKSEMGQLNRSSLMPRKNGLRWLSKVIMMFCYISQLCFPEIIIYIRMRGKLEKNQEKLKRPAVVQFAKKLDFLRKLYNIPEIKRQCWEHGLVPMDQSKRIPSYLLQQYNLHLHNLYKNLYSDQLYLEYVQDYVLELQLKLLINRFDSLKSQIIEAFNDLRFQTNLTLIFDLYSQYVRQYDGNINGLKKYENLKWAKDIIVSCLLKHIQFLISQENTMKQKTEIRYLNFDNNKRYIMDFKENSTSSAFTKFFYIKIFACDLIAMDQPFPQIFKFVTVKNNKIDIRNDNQTLGQLLYNNKVQYHFWKKYHLKIEFIESNNQVLFKSVPNGFDDITKEVFALPWDLIIFSSLKIIIKYKEYLKIEIDEMTHSVEFKEFLGRLTKEMKYYKEQNELLAQLNNIMIINNKNIISRTIQSEGKGTILQSIEVINNNFRKMNNYQQYINKALFPLRIRKSFQ